MKIITWIISILVCLGLIGLGGFRYYGGFVSVEVTESVQGGETIVYQEAKGNYNQTPKIMDEVYYYLLDQGIETYKGLGIYFDHPDLTTEDDLRSEVGCVIEEEDIGKLSELEKYAVKVLEEKEYMTITFPYKGVPSIFIGMRKAYPVLMEYAEQKGYDPSAPMIEMYDVRGKTISFWREIYRSEVPEIVENELEDDGEE